MENKEEKNYISNVMNEKEVRNEIINLLDKIHDIVGSTSGPFGKSVIIQDNGMMHFTTKDGYTVMERIVFKKPFERTIHDFIKKVSSKLNRTVGDGTTSAVLISTRLYKSLLNYSKSKKIPYSVIFDCLKSIEKEFTKNIFNYVRKIEPNENNDAWLKELYKVAYTSSNNNDKIAKIICDAFKTSPYSIIDFKMGNSEECFIETNSGFEHTRGYVSNFFALRDRKFEASGEVYILMSYVPITEMDLHYIGEILGEICLKNGKSLVILAPSFADGVMQMIYSNKVRPEFKDKLNICLVDIATKSDQARELFNDLAAFTGCKPFYGDGTLKQYDEECYLKKQVPFTYMGKIDSVSITENNSKFYNNKLSEEVIERRNKILEELKQIQVSEEKGTIYDKSEEIAKLRKRLTNLSDNGSVFIRVGATTDQERRNLQYLIEDAIYACRSAINNGIVPGLNYANIKTIDSLDKEVLYDIDDYSYCRADIIEIIRDVYIESTKFILKNGNPRMKDSDANEIIKNMIDHGILYDIKNNSFYNNSDPLIFEYYKIYNSVEADIEVFKTALSIIGLLLNSSNFICSTGFTE